MKGIVWNPTIPMTNEICQILNRNSLSVNQENFFLLYKKLHPIHRSLCPINPPIPLFSPSLSFPHLPSLSLP